jgi:hypothetical protein
MRTNCHTHLSGLQEIFIVQDLNEQELVQRFGAFFRQCCSPFCRGKFVVKIVYF